ncbi:uncharacterized protein LOC133827202 [Humulus lupulus]|uniref:uncharacterized protein LOC133827202 n=1 Tax=Humulus lupulus TaxID=3486 RepID=UPI002B4148FA|nr:uncharacterized protein LOC133827202 [Humulus lupulus]
MFKDWCFSSNNAWHPGGRIMISWNPRKFTVNILWCTSQMMHLEVWALGDKESFLVTFVYALNDEGGRTRLWNDLVKIASGLRDAWLILGDFNDILSPEERVGKRTKSCKSSAFRDCVEGCKLEDVKFSGCFFTWNNKQGKEDRIYSKIDRVMANQRWINRFPNAEAVFLTEGSFDHSPAMLSVYPEVQLGKKPFRFFRMWQNLDGFQQCLNSWKIPILGTPMYQLVSKLKRLKCELKELNKNGVGDIQAADRQANEAMMHWQQMLQSQPLNEEFIAKEQETRCKYQEVHKAYISFLHQKAKVQWLKEGDDNTAVLHASIRARKTNNRIYSIRNMAGEWMDDPRKVTEAFLEFYKELLGTQLADRRSVITHFNE